MNLPYDGANDSLMAKVREMGVNQKAKKAGKKAGKKVAAALQLQKTQATATDCGAETDPAVNIDTDPAVNTNSIR